MKTLARNLNLIIATLCLIIAATGFFGSILLLRPFQGIFFGILTLIAISILRITRAETN